LKNKLNIREQVPAELLTAIHGTKEKRSMAKRMTLLGIPENEMTESVSLAVSVLLEKLDDIGHELDRAKENYAELEQLVDVDCVAPVPNRRAFIRRLEWALSMRERYDHPCSILFFDLNNFKTINDTYGHAAGDEAIRHVSKIFTESLRHSDFMARLGGDEFAILMYHASLNAARARGKKIAERIAASSFIWESYNLPITVACGVYEVIKGDNIQLALSRADAAMYEDKKYMKQLAMELKES
jgi:diguanylate cyclase (GGDEF)-like protein